MRRVIAKFALALTPEPGHPRTRSQINSSSGRVAGIAAPPGGATAEATAVAATSKIHRRVAAPAAAPGVIHRKFASTDGLIDLGNGVKGEVGIPLIATNRINMPDVAEAILSARRHSATTTSRWSRCRC